MEDFTGRLAAALDWSIPEGQTKIVTIDAHTEGEPLRVILGGFPHIPGGTILERRRYARDTFDRLRTALMWEPRGHADMYGCLIVEPITPEADFGVLFMHNEGFSTMCGHGIIAVTKVAVEIGLMPAAEPITAVRIDTPAGLVTSHARVSKGKVTSVYFHNVASFAAALDESIDIPGIGPIRYDLAFGGAFYAFVDSRQVGLSLTAENFRPLIEKGMAVKRAVMAARAIEHPFEKDLGFLYGTIFVGLPQDSANHSRNVCIFAEGEVDRSPTGTGVSARLAIHHARGEIKPGEPITIESIIGTTFTGRVVREQQFGPHRAIVPEVEGRAFITGRHEFTVDPDDSLKDGFILR